MQEQFTSNANGTSELEELNREREREKEINTELKQIKC